jgi:hypothetical protein
MKYILILLLSVSAISFSCNFLNEGIDGNGVIKSENRKVSNFDMVDVSGNMQLYVTQGATHSVRIETDENLLEFIEVSESGGRLHIRPRDNFNLDPSKEIKVYVSAPGYKGLGASGACQIYSENKLSSSNMLDIDLSGASHAEVDVDAPKVVAGLSGASSVQLSGKTKELDLDGSGSSDIKTGDLLAETVDVDISGAGEAEVFASVKLDVHISGAGSVRYKGNPSVSQSISGAGSISKAD